MYKSLQIPPEVIDQITKTLRKSHKDKTQFHRSMLQTYQNDYQKYENRIERMYEDKLDGKVDDSLYSKKAESTG